MTKEEKMSLIKHLLSKPTNKNPREAIMVGKDGFPKIYAFNLNKEENYDKENDYMYSREYKENIKRKYGFMARIHRRYDFTKGS